ncbi:MAG: ATP-binding protein [Firmicutes bacterium]|nr:ATP-binding protein [Bacillota bacterium]
MFFKRHAQQIVNRVAKNKSVVVVTGARQVGKSTMLKRQFANHNYITLDSPTVFEAVKENPSAFLQLNGGNIIIDEIQKAPSLFEYIKLDVDNKKQAGKFVLTGSQSFSLMRGITETLAGRAGIIKMLGLSSREIEGTTFTEPFKPTIEQTKEKQNAVKLQPLEKIVERVHKGSFPELYETATDLDDWRIFYDSYVKTYLEKDVKQLINIKDESSFIKFLRGVAALTGEQLSYIRLAEICGKDIKTIKSWLSVLEACGLVYFLEPYFNNVNKRMIKSPKMYLLDTGLACFLGAWNTPQQLINGAKWGSIFETYVVSEILKSYYNAGVAFSPPLYYYRDKDKKEIDLIIEEAGTLYPIEIKATSNPTSQMAKNLQLVKMVGDKKVGEGAVICLYNGVLPLGENALAINALYI